MFGEIQNLEPYKKLTEINVPVLLIHGDADHYVSYNISKKYSALIKKYDFLTIRGVDHEFDNPKDEKIVISAIKKWINELNNL